MKELLYACVALAAFGSVGTTSAQAGGFSFNFGHGSHHGSGIGIHFGGHSSGHHGSHYRSYRSPRRSWYHDTSHYDYHPGRYVRHRDHYDYVPGHYDYHRTGHWHR